MVVIFTVDIYQYYAFAGSLWACDCHMQALDQRQPTIALQAVQRVALALQGADTLLNLVHNNIIIDQIIQGTGKKNQGWCMTRAVQTLKTIT